MSESQGTRIRRLFANTSIYALGEIGLQLLSALMLPILTAFLAPDELGIWSYSMMLLIGWTHLSNPALHGAVTRFYFDHEHDEARRRRFQGTILAFILMWSAGLCLLLFLVGPALFDALFEDLPFWPYGAFVAVMAFVGVLGVVPKATWVAAEKSRPFVGVALLGSSVNLVGSLMLVAWTGLGVLGLFWGRTASLVIIAIPFVIFSLRHVGLAWHLPDLRLALRFSLPLVPHLLAHWLLGMSDRYLIDRMYNDPATAPPDLAAFSSAGSGSFGKQAVGVYAAAYVFIDVVNMIAASMNRAWVPQFTRAYAKPEERPFVARSISWFVLAVGSMSAALVVLSPSVVRWLFDERYVFAAEIAQILAIGGLFQGTYYIYVAGLFYYKANRLIPVITILSGGANIALNLVWIPTLGLAGAAWATLVGYLVLALGMRWGCRRLTRLPFERGRVARIAIVLTLTTVVGVLLDQRLPLGWELVAKTAVLGLGALALWRLGAFSKDNAPDHGSDKAEDTPQTGS